MQTKRAIFPNRLLPYLLLAPQLAITGVFFLWPASQAIWQSFLREDAFGFKTTFVGVDNYIRLLADPTYLNSLYVSAVFAISTALLSLGLALVLAVACNSLIRSRNVYSTLLVWPYA
ncbi:MAG: carbohydrate ABC transporter permease, partial [Pannonibacter phragmitetus]